MMRFMYKMLENVYKLCEVDEHGWGTWSVPDNVLEELSKVNCIEDKDDSDPLRLFFQQQEVDTTGEVIQLNEWKAQSSLLDARDVPVVKTVDNVDSISASVMEVKPACTEDENGSPEGTTGMPVDQKTGDDILQNEALDLLRLLDEQTATVEQLSSSSEQQLACVLSKLSDAGLCHTCTLICSMSASEQSKLGSLVCRLLLVPRLQENSQEPPSRAVVKALVKFTKSLPHLSCAEVLLPVMLTPYVNEKDTVLQIVTEALSPQHKENLLRSFLRHEPERLHDWQIPLLQELLCLTCGDTARQQLVHLLATSATDLAQNTLFAKLLIGVIQQLGPGAPPDVLQQLAEVVSRNKSVLKRAAEKALRAL